MTKRIAEEEIDRILREAIEHADLRDGYQARRLHIMLGWMLAEHDDHGRRWWLTAYGRKVLAEMHEQIGQGQQQSDVEVGHVLTAVKLLPPRGGKRNLGHVWRDIEIACDVGVERIKHEAAGNPISISQACKIVADQKKYGLKWRTIRNIVYKVTSYRYGTSTALVPSYLRGYFSSLKVESGNSQEPAN